MKILLISNFQKGVGGISLQVELLNKLLNKEPEYQASIFSLKNSIPKRILLFFKLIWKGRNYDIFHIHACSYLGFLPIVYGVIVGKILAKKLIVTYHGGDADNFFKKHKFISQFFLKRVGHIIVLSGYLESVFKKFNYSVTVIPNIIEADGSNFIQRSPIEPKIISIRSLEPLYNIDLILNAFSFVQKTYPYATLTILGDGSKKHQLQTLSRELQLRNVEFVGQVDNSKIYEYLTKADILVNSPNIDNMPVSLLEAFSAGLLVISSNVGGVPYMVKHQENGLLFEKNSMKELAQQLIYAIENQEKSKQMIANAYGNMKCYYWKFIKGKIFELYEV